MDLGVVLDRLQSEGNLRTLPQAGHEGKFVLQSGRKMLNLSSNDYLGIASDKLFISEFLEGLVRDGAVFTSSSSRLLTGNSGESVLLESELARWTGKEDALVFSSGYHMNVGILPAISDSTTLILADKLVHASLIDGIRLSQAKCIRYRHQDLGQLERLVAGNVSRYTTIIIVTESIFSMDGDVTDIAALADIRKRYPGTVLYVDEAHAVGVRGDGGAGVAREQNCTDDIDFLCGTFGKAMASIGAFVSCSRVAKNFLVNRMRPLIYTTALPPVNIKWTRRVLSEIPYMDERRRYLAHISGKVRNALEAIGRKCPSGSNIIPVMAGDSFTAVSLASSMQDAGYYLLAIRPPTVPEGTARLRISLTASVSDVEVDDLISRL